MNLKNKVKMNCSFIALGCIICNNKGINEKQGNLGGYMELTEIKQMSERIKANISKVIVGKEDITDLVLTCLFCSGHVLLEDVPGVGKTMLAKSLAKSLDCDFKRIQFTPDLLPSDLTGINYFDQKQTDFIFRPGPIFANVILADEINRATPRTQSSLLECMEEGQVTIDGDTRKLKRPFFVIATQNPIEIQGTFPLPEAQLDRFFMRLKIGYPVHDEGRVILERFTGVNPLDGLESVADSEDIKDAQNSFSSVLVNDAIKEYIIDIIEMTRKHEKISLGVSPRGSLALMKASQVLALLDERSFVIPDDVKKAVVPVIAHRILIKGHAMAGGTSGAEDIISEIVEKVKAPVEDIM
jgi:MoxR-like ATPase